MARALTLLLTFALPLLLHAGPILPAASRAGIGTIAAMALQESDPRRLTHATQGAWPTAYIGGRCMVGFIGRTTAGFVLEDQNDDAILWGSRIGGVVSFRVDAHQLHRIAQLDGLDYAELAGKVVPHLDRVLRATRVDSVHQAINLPQAYTGKDVLIGVTDWGFDYTHPMFMDTTLSTTRIRAAWDQYRQFGPAPNGFGYGTELATPADLLTAGSDTANIYSMHTHGTHVAGIAGGSGAGTPYRGIAYEAGFLFATFIVDAAAVIDAFAWMQQIAAQDQKRLVVNMSWGLHHIGTLDGTSLIGQVMDAMSNNDGVVFVTSGGNNGNVNFHIRKEFSGDTLRSRIQFYPYSANPNMWGQSISMWGEPGQAFSGGFSITNTGNTVLQESPWYHSATQPYYLDSLLVQGTDTVFFNLTCDAAHPLNGRPHMRLRIKNTNTQLRIVLKASAAGGTVHFWNVTELTNDVGNWGQAFEAAQPGWTAGDRHYGIGEPACNQSSIAVAAYSAETYPTGGPVVGGAIATFSSYGPTLDERMKPDITAPGVSVASAISSYTDASFTPVATMEHNGTTYPFARFSGTSMSSPAVAGIAALVLEAAPAISPESLKDLLKSTARTDANTGIIPPEGSTRWGMGKVNAYRALVELLGLSSAEEQQRTGVVVWPNPTSDVLYILPPVSGGVAEISVVDLSGRTVFTASHAGTGTFTLNMEDRAPGLYLLRWTVQGATHTTKLVRE